MLRGIDLNKLTKNEDDGGKDDAGRHLVVLDDDNSIKAANAAVIEIQFGRLHPKTEGLGPNGAKDEGRTETDERAEPEKRVAIVSGKNV